LVSASISFRLHAHPLAEAAPGRGCLLELAESDDDDLDAMEAGIVAQGGEGVCIRAPGSFYRPNGFLKVKRLFPDINRSHLD
jgi:ATP-dependent DNA ligase